MKKALTCLLVVLLLVCLPMQAQAAELSGKCGPDATWTYDEATQTLTITGTGYIYNYPTWSDISRDQIKTVIIGEGITTIGNEAFQGCTSLTSVSLPSTLTTIDYRCFKGCTSLESIGIPEGVTYIGQEAFRSCSSLSDISLPETLTELGDYAFVDCDSLTEITFPSSLTYIPYECFASSGLKTVTIPEGVTGLSGLSFAYCDDLTTVYLPSTITSIREHPFDECEALKEIHIADIDAWIKVDCPFGITSGTSAVLRLNGEPIREVVVPEGTTSIGNSVFYGFADLEKVTIPDSVTSIGYNAFYNCASLKAINIPDGVTSISRGAFSGCSSLKDITLPSGVTVIDESTFAGCSALSSITIEGTLTKIGSYAFYNCASLKEIELPEGLSAINEYTFYGCEKLKEVSIPSTVSEIATYAFHGCSRLKNVVIPEGITRIEGYTFQDCADLESVTLPSTLTSIGSCAFMECSDLSSIVIPEGVTDIDFFAFWYCNELKSITLPSTLKSFGSQVFSWGSPVEEVHISDLSAWCNIAFTDSGSNPLNGGGSLILNGTAVTDLVIPSDVTSISDYAFYGCGGLSSVNIPAQVEQIGDYAFSNATMSTAVVSGTSEISSHAFSSCPNLSEIALAEGIEYINDYAFSGCKNLLGITIPSTVTDIEEYAFGTALKAVQFKGDAPDIDEDAFSGVTANAYYPQSNSTWTSDMCVDYGGTLTWNAACPDDHAMSAWEVTVAATCRKNGEEKRTCQNCSYFEVRATALGEHTQAISEGYDATCTTEGKTDRVYCSVCRTTLTESEPIPVTDHLYQNGSCVYCGAQMPVDPSNPFTDVAPTDFFYQPVLWAVNNGITNGYGSDTTFAPNVDCTRGQVVTFLWRAFGSPEPTITENPFTDVKEADYFYKAVLWALENEITTGLTPTEFGADAICTRGQVATFLWRAAGKPMPTSSNNPFEDVAETDYFYSAVLWAVEKGVTNGYGNDYTFAPGGNCNRGQIVTFLYRALK